MTGNAFLSQTPILTATHQKLPRLTGRCIIFSSSPQLGKAKKNRGHGDGKEVFDGSFHDNKGRKECRMPQIVGVGLTFVSKKSSKLILSFLTASSTRSIFILACFC